MSKAPRSPYKRTTHDGNTVNWRTKGMLLEAERRLGYKLTIHQGSYSSSVSQSAGTHDGGGAVDLASFDHENKVRVLRAIGFAAWYRPTIPGLWNAHIHAIAIGDKEMSSGARAQTIDYRNHRDGLASHSADHTWHPDPIPTFSYRKWRRNYNKDWFSMATKADLQEVVKDVLENHLDAIAGRVVKKLLDQTDIFPNNPDKTLHVRSLFAELSGVREAGKDDATAVQLGRVRDRLSRQLGEQPGKEELFRKIDEVLAAIQAQSGS